MPSCWLIKSEPEVFSIDDLKKARVTGWDGVRNFEARNSMRDLMEPGAQVLFYHSNADPSGIAGVARVEGPPVPDPTQFQRKSEYFDPTSDRKNPRWQMVNVAFVERFDKLLSLAQLKADPQLKGMLLFQKGQRLSVQPVAPRHFARVLELAKV